MKKQKIVLEFKYPERPWQEYDWTVVPGWADTQEERMKREHPNAQHRRRLVKT